MNIKILFAFFVSPLTKIGNKFKCRQPHFMRIKLLTFINIPCNFCNYVKVIFENVIKLSFYLSNIMDENYYYPIKVYLASNF